MTTLISTNVAAVSTASADADTAVTLTGAQLVLQSGESGVTHGQVTWDLWGRINDGNGNLSYLHQQWVATYDLVPGQAPTWDYDSVDSMTFDDVPEDMTENFDMYMQPFALVGANSDTVSVTLAGPAVGSTTGYGNVVGTYHVDWILTSSETHMVVY